MIGWRGLAILAILAGPVASVGDSIPKLLYLITEEDRIIASNIQFSRFDELRLRAQESIQREAVAEAVAVVVTNQRILGYSAFVPAWQALRVRADEQVVGLAAEDYSATVVTSQRVLNFNGRRGVWVEQRR